MPSNPKYHSSTWSRVGKITAALFGGYIVTMLLHMSIGIFIEDKAPLVMTAIWSSWLLWVGCMILTFSLKKAWHAWCIFAIISSVLAVIIVLFR